MCRVSSAESIRDSDSLGAQILRGRPLDSGPETLGLYHAWHLGILGRQRTNSRLGKCLDKV